MKDPAFYDFFVYDAYCHLTDTISKKKCLYGTAARYHSLILDHDYGSKVARELNIAATGDVITLDSPPLAINILIDDPKITPIQTLIDVNSL